MFEQRCWALFGPKVLIINMPMEGMHAPNLFKNKSLSQPTENVEHQPQQTNALLSSTLAHIPNSISIWWKPWVPKKKRLLVGRFGISSERVVLEKVERKICSARFLYTNCCGMTTTKLPVCWCGWRRRCLSFTAIFTSHDLVRNAEPGCWLQTLRCHQKKRGNNLEIHALAPLSFSSMRLLYMSPNSPVKCE